MRNGLSRRSRATPDGQIHALDPAGVDDQNSMQVDLVSSLRTVVESAGLNPKKLTVALETNGEGASGCRHRRSIPVTDGRKMARWYVPSLVDLFRGSQPPPANIDQYPARYALHFFFIENHLLTVCDSMGDRPDQEMEEIYAALRRRPNGRSLGAIHDFLWQVAALLLGIHVVSAGEYVALFGQLARSVGKWALRPVSRNYAAYLRKTFVEARAEPSLLPYNLMGQALRHFNMPQ